MKKHDENTALIIVDMQNDFLNGGQIQVSKDVNDIIPIIHSLQNSGNFEHIIITQHVYPTQIDPKKTTLVDGFIGAEIYSQILSSPRNLLIKKQIYSAFETEDNALYNYLKSNNVQNVYICGLAYDCCVRDTALAAVKFHFNTYIIESATKSYTELGYTNTKLLLENNGVIHVNEL